MSSGRWPRRALGALLGLAFASPALAVSVPANFVVENAVPGDAFVVPTTIAFLPDGRLLVGEQQGAVWMVANGVRRATPVWTAQTEILQNGDRGLLGMAVDPRYFQNHYVYFLYTVDPDSNGADTNTPTYSRLTRYQMRASGDTNTVDPATRTVLIGTDWRHGVLSAGDSHSIGSLRWGRDGSLLVSAGDGADYDVVDAGGLHPTAFGPTRTDPYDDIGAFRSQDITSLCGKILRINPANGHGYASNPYADGDLTSVRSRVWAYGLRNPFRFTTRPGTGSVDTSAANPGVVYIGDVGWTTWEEMSVATQGGQNFGWPCFEGFAAHAQYQAATPAHNGCGSVGTPTNPAPWKLPAADWHHTNPDFSHPPGVSGITSIGGTFYSDTLYPAAYRGRYFYADYGNAWIRVATFGAGQALVSMQDFGTNMDGPVDLTTSPINHDVYYVSITTGEVRRIRYTGAPGGNTPPVASATGSPQNGAPPLLVTFDGGNCFDPDGDALTYSWVFGDGGVSSLQSPTHTYLAAGTYPATLTVTDGRGGSSQTQLAIVVGSTGTFPTTPVVDNFDRANGAIGASWTATAGGFAILNNSLRVASQDASAVWNAAPFGVDQECYVTLSSLAAGATETDLMLKVQGLLWSDGCIEIWYDATAHTVKVLTYDSAASWREWGTLTGVTFSSGDRFGARALANGKVEVFRNQIKLGEASVVGWPYYNLGGRIGFTFVGALNEILDDFGGGNWTPIPTVPVVTVTSPNGGESWVGGSAQAITWVATDDVGVVGVDVYYRDGASAAWTPLALGAANSGSFTWFVHNTPGSATRVRVVARDGAGNSGEDVSNGDFTIVATPGGKVATTLRDFQMPGTQPLGAGTFASHNSCYTCHGGYDAAVEPGRNFRGTMMSQAARDPLFYACLAIAEQDAPSSGDLCIRCHSPFAWLSGRSQPTSGSQISAADRDGVSCDFCHRLVDPIYQSGVNPVEDQAVLSALLPAHRPTGYSNGQYVVDADTRRRGPFADPVTPHPWLASSFHTRSELCGTCHDVSNPVYTRVAGADYVAGPLNTPADSIGTTNLMPLERTFSEWRASAYPAGVVAPQFAGNAPGGVVSQCQDCHLRSVTGRGCSNTAAPVRTNLPLHDLTGGNAWMGGVIATLYPSETDSSALAAGAARARALLGQAATLAVTVASQGDSFVASVRVTNRTGHKLPTGYPEGRRMWLNVRARDGAGVVVYESGAYDGASGVLSEDARARVYEAKLGLSPGQGGALGLAHGPTFHFALNDTLYKDNRIPPLGFTNAAFAAFGGAPVDPQGPSPRYADGQNWDEASYPLPASARRVTATLYYQSSSKEYVEFLQTANTSNIAGQVLYDAWLANGRAAPVTMAADSLAFGTTPGAVTDLAATPVLTGHDADGTLALRLDWTSPAMSGTALVYRKAYGDYPLYRAGVGQTPPAPASPAGALAAGWTLTAVTAPGGTDEVAQRDQWHYVVFTQGASTSPVSNVAKALNYVLSDVSNGLAACAGDNVAGTVDISLLGQNYGVTVTPAHPAVCADVGPTTDQAPTSRPVPDGVLDFDDLAIFAINYGLGLAPAAPALARATAASADGVALSLPATPGIGGQFDVGLRMAATGRVQALSAELGFDPAVVAPVAVGAGPLLMSQGQPYTVLSSKPGDVDLALLGPGGISGEGEVANVRFTVLAAGSPAIHLSRVRARDRANQEVAVHDVTSATAPPSRTELRAAAPNPFTNRTMLDFALARSGPIELSLYSVDGRRVRTLASGPYAAGVYHVAWDGTGGRGERLAAGVYFVRLQAGAARMTRAVVLLQ